MPSILELSHELLKRTRRPPPSEAPAPPDESDPAIAALEGRISRLEENERNQAELVTNMAEQLEQLTVAVTALHGRWRMLMAGLVATGAVALVALIIAVRLSLVHTLP
jgi:flagellar motor switch/type III secretory pathway protein FliN